MARPRWHKAVKQALEKVGEDWVTEILHGAMKANHIKSVKERIKILDDCVKNGLYVGKKQREKAIQKAREVKT